jgi:hypothetical protein
MSVSIVKYIYPEIYNEHQLQDVSFLARQADCKFQQHSTKEQQEPSEYVFNGPFSFQTRTSRGLLKDTQNLFHQTVAKQLIAL